MANKQYIGISIEEAQLKVAVVEVESKKLKLKKIDLFPLTGPLKSKGPSVQRNMLEEPVGDDISNIFGLGEGEEPESIDLENELEHAENWDMTGDIVDEKVAGNSNELMIEQFLSDVSRKRVNIGLSIPYGTALFQSMEIRDFDQLKDKQKTEIIEERLMSIYNKPLNADHYAWQKRDDGSLLVASFDGDIPLLETLDAAGKYYNGRMVINDIMPDEAVLVGMVANNYDLVEDEFTVLVHITNASSRIIFMKGNKIFNVLPVINEKARSNKLLNTLFSKILFEIDRGELPSIDRIIITNPASLGNKARNFFQEKFVEIMVENFELNPDKIEYSDEQITGLMSHASAIGAAWLASGLDSDAFPGYSLMPRRVKARQQIFKITWHSIALILLIGFAPVMFNQMISERQSQINGLTNDINLVQLQINETRPVAAVVDVLTARLNEVSERLGLLEELSESTLRHSRTLKLLNDGIGNIPSTWITGLSLQDDNLVIEGFTLYRDRVPRVSNLFRRATILRVNQEEIRDEIEGYNFAISVARIVGDESEFTPEVQIPPMELMSSEVRQQFLPDTTGLSFIRF
ncbi:MAG: PilN domain-containing protein [Cyclonatronaceae bacterium]